MTIFSFNRKGATGGQSGNIFLAIFGAVAMVGIVGSGVMTFMKGPVQSAITANKSSTAQSQMAIAGELAIMSATNAASSGDCDSDGYVEPAEWRTAVAPATAPTGGGLIPNSIGAAKQDPWGTDYGYCVWDHGEQILTAACQTTPSVDKRLEGTNSGAYPVIAIISAGPDKVFTTTCRNFSTGSDRADQDNNGVLTDSGDLPLVSKTDGTDDVIFTYTYEGAQAASGGLWALKSSDSGTAYLAKNIEAQNATFSGLGSFDQIGATGSDFLAMVSGLKIADASVATTCNATNKGVLRRSASGTKLEICDGVSSWAEIAGGSGGSSGSDDEDIETPESLGALKDGRTDYTSKYNMFGGYAAGDYSLDANVQESMGWGYGSLMNASDVDTLLGFGYATISAAEDEAYYLTAFGSEAMKNYEYYEAAAFGASALKSLADEHNVNDAVGAEALMTGTDIYDNLAVGSGAMKNIAESDQHVAIGAQALGGGTESGYGVAYGYRANYALADGDDGPIAIGAFALENAATSSSSTALGAYSLNGNATNYSTGNDTAIGYGALMNITDPYRATAVGSRSAYNVTTGIYLTSAGYKSLYNALSAQGSTAFGAFANYNAQGDGATAAGFMAAYTGAPNVVAIGDSAFFSGVTTPPTGSKVIAIGSSAAYGQLGTNIVAIGFEAMKAAGTNTDTVAIGANANKAGTSTANSVFIGVNVGLTYTGSSGNVGIGYQALKDKTSGDDNTAVGYQANFTGAGGSGNTTIGSGAGSSLTGGAQNTAFGYQAGYNMQGDANNTFVGYGVQATTNSLLNSAGFGYGAGASVSAANTIRFGNGSVTSFTGQVAWTATSDRRVKKDIEPTDLGIDFIMKLKPVSYKLKAGNGRIDYGFIAQDVEQALDGRVTNMIIQENDEAKTYEMRMPDLLSPMVRAIQQQQAELESLQKQLDTLESESR